MDCDYKLCRNYKKWLCDSWNQFRRHTRHNYWDCHTDGGDKLTYVHPDVIRRYLQDGPCRRCGCAEICDTPCEKYCRWWDARMAVLKRKLQMSPQ